MSITLRQSNIKLNPTGNRIPVKSGTLSFKDSVLEQTGEEAKRLSSIFDNNVAYGLQLAQINDNIVASLGDYNGLVNETAIIVNDDTATIHFNGISLIDTPGVTTPTGDYLRLTINHTEYLIPLYN